MYCCSSFGTMPSPYSVRLGLAVRAIVLLLPYFRRLVPRRAQGRCKNGLSGALLVINTLLSTIQQILLIIQVRSLSWRQTTHKHTNTISQDCSTSNCCAVTAGTGVGKQDVPSIGAHYYWPKKPPCRSGIVGVLLNTRSAPYSSPMASHRRKVLQTSADTSMFC